MSARIGSVNIENVSGGTVQFGDIMFYSPVTNTDTTGGSGSGNSGAVVLTISGQGFPSSGLRNTSSAGNSDHSKTSSNSSQSSSSH